MLSHWELLLAFALDLAVGDPRWLSHPVRLIGKAIEKGEAFLRKRGLDGRAGGAALAASIVAVTFLCTYFLVIVFRSSEGGQLKALGIAAIVYLASTTLALRGLLDAVREVLKSRDIAAARRRLSFIVGRDTQNLDEEGVRRAAIETLAENASDGVVAPLFYLAIGGLPLAMTYKAVNTLDSMVGYKNEKYREFGWASARLDDILNYIPARLTGALIVAATLALSGLGAARRAFKVMLKDGRNHSSPNSGYPEAAMAGALGVRLGGPSTYWGVLVEKPYIFAAGAEECQGVGPRALRIAFAASLMGVAASALFLFWRAA